MRLFSIIFFLTLVGTHCGAASVTNSPTPNTNDRIQHGLTRPTIWGLRKIPRSPQRLQMHLGYIEGSFFENNRNEFSPYLGAMILSRQSLEKFWTSQLDFATKSWLRLGFGQRWTLSADRTHLPYLHYGLVQTVKTEKLIAGILDLHQIKATAGLGFGNLFDENEHWNLQFDLQYGVKGAALQITMGWNIDL